MQIYPKKENEEQYQLNNYTTSKYFRFGLKLFQFIAR